MKKITEKIHGCREAGPPEGLARQKRMLGLGRDGALTTPSGSIRKTKISLSLVVHC